MQIRIFQAASLHEALEEIRQQMGPSASVIHTRHVRDGWMGWLGQSYVEVTARVDVDQPPKANASDGSDSNSMRQVTDARSLQPQGNHAENIQVINPAVTVVPGMIPLPAQLLSLRDQLVSLGVPTATVQRWINATNSFAVGLGDSLSQPWLEHLQRTVSRELRFGGPIRIPPGSRHIVALVGPTGVGKTTTVAKLAAGFRIDAKRRVGLLTIDTFRIAAVQQLKSYAEIMDLPMQVVERPDQMRPALDSLGDVDLILIDTAGRSPRSDARIDQLVDLLRSAQPDETHLVLSANHSTSSIDSVVKGFARAQPTAAILTKLDETPYTASIVSAITASNKYVGVPVSYVTNGQQVPDDIAVANAEILLRRLLPTPVALPEIEAA